MRRALPAACLALLALALAVPPPADAHLAMIRQGLESDEQLESNDQFGSALAAGDFDGDGFDDLAIGSPTETLSGLASAGGVTVVYGSKWGLTHVGATHRSAAVVGGFLDAGAEFGRALVAGDFDGDGIDDLAIGAPGEDISGTIRAGRVYVVHGSLFGLDASADTILSESHGGGSIEADDEFGACLAAGDFNLDGRDDLAIGAPGEDAGAGTVFEFHGSANGITRVGAHFFKQADLGGTNTAGDRFGTSLASGNFAGSDHPDLAVGAPQRTANFQAGAGVVYLILGSGSGLVSAGALPYSGASHAGGAEAAAHFGAALAGGHFFASTYQSLAIGEPERNVGATIDAGQVVTVRGGAAGLDFGVGGVRVLTQVANDGAEASDHFGAVLAAADRRGFAVASWGADGFDELAVGTPEENGALQSQVNVGLVQIFRGTSSGPTASNYEIYTQEDLGDDSEPGDFLGAALAFGAFDRTEFANLAIGASLENTSNDLRYDQAGQTDLEEFSNAGAVFVSAPWRQVLGLQSRGTVVYNCAFELVYSQRPFDKVRPASTTKTMTALLAAERMAVGHPDHVDSTDVIDDIPQWIDDVGGTAIWTGPGEHIRFVDACRGMVMKSGNDAAYLVGRRIRPDHYDSDASDFVALMNTKAAAIGMSTRTRYSNPAGLDTPADALVLAPDRDNYTTPDDMALLLREGMFDPVFRMLLGTTSWAFTRLVEIGGDPEDLLELPWNFQNAMLARIVAAFNAIPGPNPQATAAKPGGTPWARNTEVFAVEDATGRVIVTRFGIPDGVSLSASDVALALLGFQQCDTPHVFPPGGEPMPDPIVRLDGAGTQTGEHHAASATFAPDDGDSVVVEGFLGQGTGTANLSIMVGRSTQGSLEPQEVITLTAPGFGHLGYAVHNDDALPAMLQIVASHPPTNQTIQLAPHATTRIGPFTGGSGSPATFQVQNQGSSLALLSIDEEGYVLPAQISRDASSGPGPFAALLTVSGTGPGQPYVRRLTSRSLFLRADGNDANPGRTVTLVAHAPDVPVVGVPPGMFPGAEAGRATIAISPPAPNPFSEQVRLGFVLDRPARVRVVLFDVRGRRIRMLEESRPAGPGAFVWDGRGMGGARVPAGVYAWGAFVDGRSAGSGRLIRLVGVTSGATSLRR
jgi:D-alanyl-D-alanine carboxypeptidase